MMPGRTFNLPLWVQFLGMSLGVTAVLLTGALAVRGWINPADAGHTVGLMRTATPAVTAAPEPDLAFRPVVRTFPALPVETAQPVRETTQAPSPASAMSFDGRPLRKVRDIKLKVTAYSPDEKSCGIWADGVTASGYSVWTNGMKLVAADTKLLPFGTILTVPGYNEGQPVQVLDRGGKIKGHRLDVLYPTHEIALRWGIRDLTVTVWEYAD